MIPHSVSASDDYLDSRTAKPQRFLSNRARTWFGTTRLNGASMDPWEGHRIAAMSPAERERIVEAFRRGRGS